MITHRQASASDSYYPLTEVADITSIDRTSLPWLRSALTETNLDVGFVSGVQLVNHMYLVLFLFILVIFVANFRFKEESYIIYETTYEYEPVSIIGA